MIEFPCPNCRTYLSMPDASAGKDTPCVVCGRSVAVPWPPGRERPAPEPEEEARPARRSRRSRRDDDEEEYESRRRRRDVDYDDRPRYRDEELDTRRGFRCQFCRTTERPLIRYEMSETGWILMIVLLVTFFPLFWIGFLMKENVRYCSDCGAKLGKCL